MTYQKTDEKYMHRCLELAAAGRQDVAPNPMVGCVIVYNNKIIGEGFHQNYGEAHAEVNAIAAVKEKSILKEATLYVSLEPCAHHGKTPPCSDLIIEHSLKRVVVATTDPFPEVSGKGIEKMKTAGIEVEVGILEQEARELNKAFFTFHKEKRPYIILKWAQTLDGYIDVIRKEEHLAQPNWITNEMSRYLVHKWRAEEASIMVGTRTAECDNPKLNIRNWSGPNPLRLVIDRTLRLPNDLALFDGSQKTLIIAGKNSSSNRRKENFESIENVEIFNIDFSKNFEERLLTMLYDRGIQTLIIEGGAKLLQSFIALEYWDEARVFYGDRFFYEGIKAPEINCKPESITNLWESKLAIFKR